MNDQSIGVVVEDETPEVEEVVEVEVAEVDPLAELFDDVEPQPEKGVIEKEEPEPPAVELDVVKKDEETTEPSSDPVVEEEAPTVESLQKQLSAFKAKALDETKKRQAIENKPVAEKPIEFDWDNPNNSLAAIEARANTKAEGRFLAMSASQARARHDDYTEKYDVFVEMIQENPSLMDTVVAQDDPAEYAYQLGKQKQFANEVGKDPVEYEAKLKAKHFAEFQAEQTKKDTTKAEIAGNLPPSAKSFTDKNTPAAVVEKDAMEELFDDIPSG